MNNETGFTIIGLLFLGKGEMRGSGKASKRLNNNAGAEKFLRQRFDEDGK